MPSFSRVAAWGLLAALILAPPVACAQSAFGGIHKCQSKGGAVVYQDTPCDLRISRDATLSAWNDSQGQPKTFSGQTITVSFQAIELGKVLDLISEVSGTTLYMDDATAASARGDFRYINMPWDEALRDIASRYRLIIRFGNGKMVVETEEDGMYDKLISRFQKQYPALDPASPAYDQAVVNRVRAAMKDFMQKNPQATATDGLSYAVLSTVAH